MASEQKEDVEKIFEGWKSIGNLIMLVAGIKKRLTIWEIIISEQHWYQLIQLQGRKCFDSLEPLFESGVHIDFAYRTFIWDSEASNKRMFIV